jgi:hypothetical protein
MAIKYHLLPVDRVRWRLPIPVTAKLQPGRQMRMFSTVAPSNLLANARAPFLVTEYEFIRLLGARPGPARASSAVPLRN